MHNKANFFSLHYDWLVAAAGVAALVVAAILLVSAIGTSPDDAAQRRRTQLAAVTPAHETVAPVPMDVLHGVQRLAKAPPSLAPVATNGASFLASERRVFCKPGDASVKSCGRPIPAGLAACPFCGNNQEAVKVESLDNDEDGLPNDWEKKYGLNPNDKSDADKDSDSDGFTNLEEFAAKTNPLDPSSHPPYADPSYLSVNGGLRQVLLPFWFNAVSPIPGGHRFTFRNRAARSAYDQTYSLKDGEEIGKTGWFVGKYNKLSKEVAIKGSGTNAKRIEDVSTVEVVRKADGRKMELLIGKKQNAVEAEVEIAWDRFGGKKFVVKEGGEIDLNGEKWRVVSLKAKGKTGCEVVLEAMAPGRERITLESK